MKNQLRIAHKLGLRKETIRALNQVELAEVAGGDVTTTLHPTLVVCPTARVCLTTGTNTTA